jgi:HEAT repeat protein
MGSHEGLNCPPESELLLFDDLEEAARARLLSHVGSCPRCAGVLHVGSVLDDLLAGEDEPLPAALLDRIRAIPAREPAPRIRRIRFASALAAVAAAALLAVYVGTGSRRPGPEPAAATLRSRVTAALLAPGPDSDDFFARRGDTVFVLLMRIADGSDADAARAAIRRLGATGRSEALPALADAIRKPDRREEVVAALAALGDPRAVPLLAPLLPDPALGGAAREAIATLGGDGAARALARAIAARGPVADREALVRALAGVGGRTGTRELLGLLDDRELGPTVQRAFAAYPARHVDSLLAIAGERDRRSSRRALRVLAFLAPDSAVPVLGRLLGDRDRRDLAARALVRIDTAEAGEALLSRPMTDEVQAAFLDAGPGLRRFLVSRLSGGSLIDQAQAVELLGVTGGPEAVRALAPLAGNRALAPAVLEALGRIGGPEAVEALGRLAREPLLTRSAIEALGETGAPEAVPVLARLGREDESIRGAAVRALVRLPSPGVVTAIRELTPRRTAKRILAELDPALVRAAAGGEGAAPDEGPVPPRPTIH